MLKLIGLLTGIFLFNYCGYTQYNMDFVANLKQVGGKYDIKNPEKTIGIIIYQQIYKPDTTRIDSLQIDTMALSYSQHFSDYRLNGLRELDSSVSIIIDRKSKEDPSAKNTEPFPAYNSKLSKTRFLSNENNVYQHEELFDNHYLLKYITKKEDWSINDSTKNILGFTCQKATADVLGRHYTAWFTTDIPSSFGPRTLMGLPGIILQAYDDTRQIYYVAINTFTKNSDNATIGIPSKGTICTKNEYDAMMEVFEKDPKAFFNGQKNIAVGRSRISNGEFNPKKKKKNEPRNSIELKIEE